MVPGRPLGTAAGSLFSQKINGKPNYSKLRLLRKSNKTLTDLSQTYLVAQSNDLCIVIWISVVIISHSAQKSLDEYSVASKIFCCTKKCELFGVDAVVSHSQIKSVFTQEM